MISTKTKMSNEINKTPREPVQTQIMRSIIKQRTSSTPKLIIFLAPVGSAFVHRSKKSTLRDHSRIYGTRIDGGGGTRPCRRVEDSWSQGTDKVRASADAGGKSQKLSIQDRPHGRVTPGPPGIIPRAVGCLPPESNHFQAMPRMRALPRVG